MRLYLVATVAAAALAIAGCQRTANVNAGASTLPPPVNPAPITGVQSAQLPPPGESGFPEAPQNENAGGMTSQEFEMAAANAPSVNREALLGTWQTQVGGGSCQLALSLTQWTGGYRAASLRCPGAAANIAAWDVSGNQVVLNDRNGNTVARVYQSGPQRYEGTLAAGGSIVLTR